MCAFFELGTSLPAKNSLSKVENTSRPKREKRKIHGRSIGLNPNVLELVDLSPVFDTGTSIADSVRRAPRGTGLAYVL